MSKQFKNRKTLAFALAPMLLFLQGCVTPSSKGGSHESALTALRANVNRDLQTRKLPNGKEYCAELARTQKEQDACTGDLEDGFYLSNRDKERARKILNEGINRLINVDRACKWWQVGCKAKD